MSDVVDKILSDVFPMNIGYKIGDAAGTLMANYFDMKDVGDRYKRLHGNTDGIKGLDDYYHTKAMFENGQKGLLSGTASLAGGMLREGYDLGKKSNPFTGTMSFKKAWDDTVKDMGNNWNGVKMGYENPGANSYEYLRYLLPEGLKR